MKIIRSKTFWQIVLLFVLPVILLLASVFPVEYRSWLLLAVTAITILIVIKEKWTLKQLGIRTDNFAKSGRAYVIFTVIAMVVIFILSRAFGRSPQIDWWTKPHFLGLFIPISFLQEFLFRGFLMPKLQIVFLSPLTIITINALLFAFMHSIFPNPLLMIPIAFIAGLAFATMYHRYPNLILISISHAVLNFMAVMYAFFSFTIKA